MHRNGSSTLLPLLLLFCLVFIVALLSVSSLFWWPFFFSCCVFTEPYTGWCENWLLLFVFSLIDCLIDFELCFISIFFACLASLIFFCTFVLGDTTLKGFMCLISPLGNRWSKPDVARSPPNVNVLGAKSDISPGSSPEGERVLPSAWARPPAYISSPTRREEALSDEWCTQGVFVWMSSLWPVLEKMDDHVWCW